MKYTDEGVLILFTIHIIKSIKEASHSKLVIHSPKSQFSNSKCLTDIDLLEMSYGPGWSASMSRQEAGRKEGSQHLRGQNRRTPANPKRSLDLEFFEIGGGHLPDTVQVQ